MKRSFIKPIMIVANGVGLPTTALCDTGADISLIMNPAIAKRAVECLGAAISKLTQPMLLRDWQKRSSGAITEQITLAIEIDGRSFRETFLIAPCAQDVFIGQHWMAEKDLWLHPRTRKILWPDDIPALARFSRTITLEEPVDKRVNPAVQRDADRRDRLMEKADREEKKIRIL